MTNLFLLILKMLNIILKKVKFNLIQIKGKSLEEL